ncbi:MAG: hypothetical protein AAGB11_17430, partial [Pseudomonadota bacterium]
LLAMLTFDGVLSLAPEHPFDAAMVDAFHAHQRTDKGMGPAAGPDAPAVLARSFRAASYRVEERDTPWLLNGERDRALITELLEGWAGAATEVLPQEERTVAGWLQSRLERTERLVVGHKDQLFLPRR